MANDNYPPGVYDMHPHFYPPDPMECPDCYADIESDWLFCPYCGRKLHPEEWDGDVYIGPQWDGEYE